MHIEIRNTHWKNQGAQLMLRAILDRLHGESLDCHWAVAGRCATTETRKELGLDFLPWVQNWGTQADLLARLLPPLHPPTWISSKKIDTVLDASGFAYGDQWGPEKARISAAYYRRLKKQGARIVLLPQALGPFENPALAEAFREVVDLVDLVYARDATSFAALTTLCGDQAHLRLAPDFTHALNGVAPSLPVPPKTVVLIPNRKMLEMGATDAESYLALFARIAALIHREGFSTMILQHSKEDGPLIRRLMERIPQDIDVREAQNPLEVKGLIGQCHGAVSSRFHGLVNALSAGVPALATGWSHKYQHLMEDFHCIEMLLSSELSDDALEQKLNLMLKDPGRSRMVARLRAAAARQTQEIDRMWEDVLACIRR